MGKKIKNCFMENVTYEKMLEAYKFARRGKTLRNDVIKFSFKYESILKEIVSDIKNRKYQFGQYRLFYVYEPKKRKILAARFRDRVVHTWYVINFLEQYFVPTFITDSYACIKEKGMHKSAYKLKKTLYNCMHNPEYENGYILKMDVRKFFDNINRDILYNIIAKKVYDTDFLTFTKNMLNSSSNFDRENEPGVGLPIGNYTSQIFANIYLNEIDQFVKHTLRCKYYFRYMDDSIAIFKSKEEARKGLELITNFLRDQLKLELNSKTQIFKIKQGVNFCGYKISANEIKLRNRGKKKLVKKLKYLNYALRTERINVKDARMQLVGHIGYIKPASIGGLLNKYFYN